MALEGPTLPQPKQPTGVLPPHWKRTATVAGLLAASAIIGMVVAHKPELKPPPPAKTPPSRTTPVVAPGAIPGTPPCDYAHEAQMVTTSEGRFECEVAPDGSHVWRQRTKPGDLNKATTSSSQQGQTSGTANTNNNTSRVGQTPEQARIDTIADQRRQLLIKAAFSDSHVNGAVQERQQQQAAPAPEPVAPQVPTPTPSQTTPSEAKQAPQPQASALDCSLNQPLYWLPEGTILDAGLSEDLNASTSGPLDAIVSLDKYYPGTRLLLVPKGSILLGEVGQVSTFGQDRVGVAFHRLLLYPSLSTGDPAPCSITLRPNSIGQDQAGANGLQGKVASRFWSTFAAAAAVGGISGLSQFGSFGANYSPSNGFFFGLSTSASQATERVLDKYLNRPPKATVPKGTRLRVRLMADQQFPAVAQ